MSLFMGTASVLVLVENGGPTPRELEVSLVMGRRETRAVFRYLVGCGLSGGVGQSHAPGALPLPWSFASSVFQLTPRARSLKPETLVRPFSLQISPAECATGPSPLLRRSARPRPRPLALRDRARTTPPQRAQPRHTPPLTPAAPAAPRAPAVESPGGSGRSSGGHPPRRCGPRFRIP
jgi:hypothetical protein